MTNKNFPTDEIITMMLTDMIEAGEINYWATNVKALRGNDEHGMIISATLQEFDEDTGKPLPKVHRVNIATIKDAIQKILDGKVEIRSDIKKSMADEDWDYDGESGDVVIQVACLGEIVYG